MQVTSVSISFRKQVSDGNYGSETAEATFSADLNPMDLGVTVAAGLLAQARRNVINELSASSSGYVRRAIEEPRPPVPAREPSGAELEDIPF